MLKEFKEFISRGNVVDLAVGVVVGGAFSTIVTSLVNDIMMPIIGVIIGGVDFSSLSIKVGDAQIMYGNFIQNIINFLIIALCIFIFVKAMNKLSKLKLEDIKNIKNKKNKKNEEVAPAEEVKEEKVPTEVDLLIEIRDLLNKTEKKAKK